MLHPTPHAGAGAGAGAGGGASSADAHVKAGLAGVGPPPPATEPSVARLQGVRDGGVVRGFDAPRLAMAPPVAVQAQLDALHDRVTSLSEPAYWRRVPRAGTGTSDAAVAVEAHGCTLACVEGVALAVGPVVGRVTDTTAVVLVELHPSAAQPAVVTCHACALTLAHPHGRPVVTTRAALQPGQPFAFALRGLLPATKHVIQFSGLAAAEASQRVAHCITRPACGSDTSLPLRLAVVSGDAPTALPAGQRNPWEDLQAAADADRIDVMLHIGCQVDATPVFHTAWLQLRRLAEAGLLRPGGSRAAAVEDTAVEAFRAAYRAAWSLPHTRETLAACSHLMVWSERDVVDGLSHIMAACASECAPGTDGGDDADSAAVTQRLALQAVLRAAQRVYREYQRQLFQPGGVDLPALQSPAQFQQGSATLLAARDKALDTAHTKDREASDARRIAQASADQASRWAVLHAQYVAEGAKADTVAEAQDAITQAQKRQREYELQTSRALDAAAAARALAAEKEDANTRLGECNGEEHWHVMDDVGVLMLDCVGNRVLPDGTPAPNLSPFGSEQLALLDTALATPGLRWLFFVSATPLAHGWATTAAPVTGSTPGGPRRTRQQQVDLAGDDVFGSGRLGVEDVWRVRRATAQRDAPAHLALLRRIAAWKSGRSARHAVLVTPGFGCDVTTLLQCRLSAEVPAPIPPHWTMTVRTPVGALPDDASDSGAVELLQLGVPPLTSRGRDFIDASEWQYEVREAADPSDADAEDAVASVGGRESVTCYHHASTARSHQRPTYLRVTIHPGSAPSGGGSDAAPVLLLPELDWASSAEASAADALPPPPPGTHASVWTFQAPAAPADGGSSPTPTTDAAGGPTDCGAPLLLALPEDPDDALLHGDSFRYARPVTAATPRLVAVFDGLRRSAGADARVTLGPVIGKVGARSAVVLLETTAAAAVSCVAVDPVSQHEVSFEGVAAASLHHGVVRTTRDYPSVVTVVAVAGDAGASSRPPQPPAAADHKPDGAQVWTLEASASRPPSAPSAAAAGTDTRRSVAPTPLPSARSPADAPQATPYGNAVECWHQLAQLADSVWHSPHVLLRLGGQVHARTAFPAALAALRRAEAQHGAPLQAMPPRVRVMALEAARDAIRDVYRRRWLQPSRRAVMSRVPTLPMWGAVDTDDVPLPTAGCSTLAAPDLKSLDVDSGPRRLLRALARQVFREYQRALWDPPRADGGHGSGCQSQATVADDRDEEWHFHVWGAVGLFVADEQSNKLLDGVRHWYRPPWSERQWDGLSRALSTPGLTTVCVATETPPLTQAPDVVHAGAPLDSTRQTWAGHPDATVRLLRVLWEWRQAAPGREASIVCGATSCSVSTVLRSMGSGGPGAMRQLAVGPLVNHVAPFAAAPRGSVTWSDHAGLVYTHAVATPHQTVGVLRLRSAACAQALTAARVADMKHIVPPDAPPTSAPSRPPTAASRASRPDSGWRPVTAAGRRAAAHAATHAPRPLLASNLDPQAVPVDDVDALAPDTAVDMWTVGAGPHMAAALLPHMPQQPDWVAAAWPVLTTSAAASQAVAAAAAAIRADDTRQCVNSLSPARFSQVTDAVFATCTPPVTAAACRQAAVDVFDKLAPDLASQLLRPTELVCRNVLGRGDEVATGPAFKAYVEDVLCAGMGLQAVCVEDLRVFRDDDT